MSGAVRSTRVRVPGKLMLCGEYAVLMGAPALLACTDNFAVAEVKGAEASSLQMIGPVNLDADFQVQRRRVRWADGVDTDALRLVTALIEQFPPPQPVALRVDSSDLYDAGRKLGLGSSAAVATALGIALAQFGGHGSVLPGIVSAHRKFQHGKGSGADIHAVARGGIVVFRHDPNRSAADIVRWPAGLLAQPVRCPESADTVDRIGRFSSWLVSGSAAREAVELAVEDAEQVVKSWRGAKPAVIIEAMNSYAERIYAIDEAAKLGYLAGGHRQVLRLAEQAGVFYKPCGAGGGDYGIALSDSADALESFRRLAGETGFGVTPMRFEDNAPSIEVRPGGEVT